MIASKTGHEARFKMTNSSCFEIDEELKSTDVFNINIGSIEKDNKIYKIPYTELAPWRQNYLDSLAPKSVFNGKWVIAGGSLRNLIKNIYPVNDVDLFTLQTEMMFEALEYLSKNSPELLFRESSTPDHIRNADFGLRDIQLIVPRISRSIATLFSTFDFHASCLAYDGTDFFYTKNSIVSCFSKEVSLNHNLTPLKTLERMFRYQKDYGWNGYNAAKDLFKHHCPSVDEGDHYKFC